MKLIGMLDSPYVRRVAISMQLLDLRFEHESVSVFRTYPALGIFAEAAEALPAFRAAPHGAGTYRHAG